MLETRGTWTDLIPDTGLKFMEAFDEGGSLYTPGMQAILKSDQPGNRAQMNFTGKTEAGELKKTDEGDAYNFDRRYRTYDTKVAFTLYSQGLEVTRLQMEDRDFDSELEEMSDLSRMGNFALDKSSCQLFNGGFATTTSVNGYDITLYGDAVPTFSTVHPSTVPGVGTQSNASSTGIVFGDDNLETALLAITNQLTDRGNPMTMVGKPMLIVPPELRKAGRKVTESELESETANNAINVYRGMIDMMETQFINSTNGGSNTAWFVVLPSTMKLYQTIRQGMRLDSAVDFNTKTMKFTIDGRWSNYVKHWKGTWGTKGDLAAYSS